jgi:hypothetical protein
MQSDLLKSIFDYASANKTIKILSADVSEGLRTLVRDRFSFPEYRPWWWEVMPDGASEIPYGNVDGATLAGLCSHVDGVSADLCAGPWHQLVEARRGPAIDEFGQRVRHPRVRIHVVEFARLDE